MEEKDANASKEGKTPGKRYSAEEKANVLRLYDKIRVTKASKQTGITINSLREWHMDAPNANVVAAADENIGEELIRLRLESTTLKAQIVALKAAIRALQSSI